ncbi:MAG TPA: Phenylacetic acid catabolic protein [Thermoanaerobaculia bacterium]|jgi:1,2-phenylacetyl-CoA epoxidase catalytic subunit|nr:Phenylacetic acid catabolic protein [Thermoanaerobaculia bacterium]
MSTNTTTLPGKFHDAVERWRERFLPDYSILLDNWEKFFPTDEPFRLCAHRECGMCTTIEVGDEQGKPKYTRACEMREEQAHHLLAAIRAQASTEFGSIQQHQLTLARAQQEQDQFWVLRMMAEELRHGYQMLHLLLDDDWSSVSKESGAEIVEEILSMRTGSHVLGAFNIDFDSFVDNIIFCALIDRVGKYQLSMQRVSAYQPMAESMPQMLREEAFHLATGVVPWRRMVEDAARGEVWVSMAVLQKHLNKWLPRGLEMFGHEKGGDTNVKFGLKPMKNGEAQDAYYQEVAKMVRDLNLRFVRARKPELDHAQAHAVLERLLGGEVVEGVARPEELLRMPHREFFRRRGEPAFHLVGVDGEVFTDVEEYVRYLSRELPEQYLAGRDFQGFVEVLRKLVAGELTFKEATAASPNLRRVGGVCPCSKSVRWVVDAPGNGDGAEAVHDGQPRA